MEVSIYLQYYINIYYMYKNKLCNTQIKIPHIYIIQIIGVFRSKYTLRTTYFNYIHINNFHLYTTKNINYLLFNEFP